GADVLATHHQARPLGPIPPRSRLPLQNSEDRLQNRNRLPLAPDLDAMLAQGGLHLLATLLHRPVLQPPQLGAAVAVVGDAGVDAERIGSPARIVLLAQDVHQSVA